MLAKVNIADSAAGGGGTPSETQRMVALFVARSQEAGVRLTQTHISALTTIASAVGNIGKDKFYAVYPFVGGAAGSHALSLIDGQYDLTFPVGGITHNSNGITGNGTTGYCETAFNPSTKASLTDFSMGVLSATALVAGSSKIFMGCQNGGGFVSYIAWGNVGSEMVSLVGDSTNLSPAAPGRSTNSAGFFVTSCDGDRVADFYDDGVAVGSGGVTQTGTFYNGNIWICGSNNALTVNAPTIANIQFVHIGKGLSAAQVATLNTAVQAAKTTLGR